MKKLLLVVISLLVVGYANAQSEKFIGQQLTENLVKTITGENLSYGMGALAFDEGEASYGVDIYSNDSKTMLIALTKIEDEGKKRTLTHYIVIDLSTFNKNATFGCEQKYGDNPNVIVALHDDTEVDKYGESPEWYTKIFKAWTIDKQAKKLVEIPTKGIKLLNEGYGA